MSQEKSSQKDSDRRNAAERRNDKRRAHARFAPGPKPSDRRQGERRNERN